MFIYELLGLKCLNECYGYYLHAAERSFFTFFYFWVLKIFILQLAGHFNIFVGDLSPEVTDATLFACFSVYPSCS